MYGSPGCPKHKFPSLHSEKFRIGQKLALKWTKTLADLHICVHINQLFGIFLFYLDETDPFFGCIINSKVYLMWKLPILWRWTPLKLAFTVVQYINSQTISQLAHIC